MTDLLPDQPAQSVLLDAAGDLPPSPVNDVLHPAPGAAPGEFPRLLVLDMTQFGQQTATGELKQTYFQTWQPDRLMHIFAAPARRLGCRMDGVDDPNAFETPEEAVQACLDFDPQVILYRPVADRPDLHEAARAVLERSAAPMAIWLMDDWPDLLARRDPEAGRKWDVELRWLLDRAAARFVICERMAEGYADRYGLAFDVLRNGINPDEWRGLPAPPERDAVVMRYAGSIAPFMTRDAVLAAARAVSSLQGEAPVRFEIRTQAMWQQREAETLAGLEGVSVAASDMSRQEYHEWLSEADILFVGYNFDEESRAYLKYSFANKIPECLASGAPVLALGPADLPSITALTQSGGARHVGEADEAVLKAAIAELAADAGLRAALGAKGRAHARKAHALAPQRARLVRALCELAGFDGDAAAARDGAGSLPGTARIGTGSLTEDHAKDLEAQLDEVRLVRELVGAGPGLMLDVGAHTGGSLHWFKSDDWTIHAFEPDPANRAQLERAVSGFENVTIHPLAVSDAMAGDVPFFASDESTGISGLSAFRDTHKEVARVDTVTLDAFCEREGVDRIHFLKIDVEGFELSVLRGLDFDRLPPDVVIAEFEDAKTLPEGYDSHQLAGFLVERGYTVYVSEWHPITAYGVRHSWRRLSLYPCFIPTESWGNLIAFRQPPPRRKLAKAVSDLVRVTRPAARQLSAAETAGPPVKTHFKPNLHPLVVMGNGPSLKGADPSAWKGVDTMGMNAAYRWWKEIDWWPTYYACLDEVVGMAHKDAIADMIRDSGRTGIRRFILRANLIEALGDLGRHERVENFERARAHAEILSSMPVTTGSHALAWGAWAGYPTIYVIGVDGRYVAEVPGSRRREGIEREIVSPAENPNYFMDGYQQPGDRYNDPNPGRDLHQQAWRRVASLIERSPTKVYNLNTDSRIDAFDFAKVDLTTADARPVITHRAEVFAGRGDADRTVEAPDPHGHARQPMRLLAEALRRPGARAACGIDDVHALAYARAWGWQVSVRRKDDEKPPADLDAAIAPAGTALDNAVQWARSAGMCAFPIRTNGPEHRKQAGLLAEHLSRACDSVWVMGSASGQARLRAWPCEITEQDLFVFTFASMMDAAPLAGILARTTTPSRAVRLERRIKVPLSRIRRAPSSAARRLGDWAERKGGLAGLAVRAALASLRAVWLRRRKFALAALAAGAVAAGAWVYDPALLPVGLAAAAALMAAVAGLLAARIAVRRLDERRAAQQAAFGRIHARLARLEARIEELGQHAETSAAEFRAQGEEIRHVRSLAEASARRDPARAPRNTHVRRVP